MAVVVHSVSRMRLLAYLVLRLIVVVLVLVLVLVRRPQVLLGLGRVCLVDSGILLQVGIHNNNNRSSSNSSG